MPGYQTLTPDQARAAVKAAAAERDAIQANLVELDRSFGHRLLAGATLTGQTKQRWEEAAAALATLWQVYSAYSAVVDQAAEAVRRHLGPKELVAVTALLAGPSVSLAAGPAPLASRDLADTGLAELTLAAAVARMRRAFTAVTELISAAEQVWNEAAGRLDAAGAELGRVTPLAASLADGSLTGSVVAAQAQLTALRDTLNSDPLALWHRGTVDTSAADRLGEQVAAAAAQVQELVRLRDGARQRITEVTTAAAAASSAADDAAAAWQRVAARIAPVPPPLPPGADVSARLAGLQTLLAGGRWVRLGSELDLLERELADATAAARDAERALVALLATRDELRGLLEAYRAKAARMGAAEDPALAGGYDHAHELLWTAPCDLTAAADAVTGYQQAVLALGGQRR
ncbi:MAG: hypothetical protein ABSA53_01030 [Streptosporangiaceae bacterium]